MLDLTRGGMRALVPTLCIALLATLLIGCGGGEGPGGKKEDTETGAAAVTANPSPKVQGQPLDKQTQAAVDACKDAFELLALQKKLGGLGAKSSALSQAVRSKADALTAGIASKNLIPGLDLLLFRTEYGGENEYVFSMLFRVTKKITPSEGESYHVALLGWVDKAHLSCLPEPARKRGHEAWEVFLWNDPISAWQPGEYHAVSYRAKAETIPYQMEMILEVRDKKRRWVKNTGHQIKLGWQAALPTSK
jgi:hypothetical protein